MSSSFTYLDTSNTFSQPGFQEINYTLYSGFNNSNISTKRQDLLALYNEELEKRKFDLSYNQTSEENSDACLTNNNIDFLKNVISIKSKILHLINEHKNLIEKSNSLQKDIESIEKMKKTYEDFSNMYSSILNKCDERQIMIDILENLDNRKRDKEYIDKIIHDTLIQIANLKNIIRSDDLEDKPKPEIHVDADTEINPTLLCFTCHEGQITHCFAPCGHSFCETCVSRVKLGSVNAICFMCRANVTGKIKLYFS